MLIGPMAAGLTLEAQARALTMANSHDTTPDPRANDLAFPDLPGDDHPLHG